MPDPDAGKILQTMRSGRVHLAGAGGVGMSALAEALRSRGIEASGSDRAWDGGGAGVFGKLAGAGVRMFPQDGSGVCGASALVVSSAIEADNRDLAAAKSSGIPVFHRSQALAAVLSGHKLIAVTGTCGKSTVTAMIGHILSFAGLDPFVVNGAAVAGWDVGCGRTGAVLPGCGEWAVTEADESDGSLLNFVPDCAVITNCSADHFSLEECSRLFDRFTRSSRGGVADMRGADAGKLPCNVSEGDWSVSFELGGRVFTLPQPGTHNAQNASAAVWASSLAGVPTDVCARALAVFPGVRRRLEIVGIRRDGVRVVDDYSHNTEKLRAALRTLRARARRVVALWRPHGFTPLKKMFRDLAEMFAAEFVSGGVLFLLPVYYAGGSAEKSVSSEDLAVELVSRGVDARFAPDGEYAVQAMSEEIVPGDVAAVFGARDPELPVIAGKLAAL